MSTISKLLVALGIDIDDYVDGLTKASKETESFSSRAVSGLSSIGGLAVVGGLAAVTAGVTALGAGLVKSVSEASSAEVGISQLDAVLQSTSVAFENAASAVPKVSAEAAAAMEEIAQKNVDTIASINDSATEKIATINEKLSDLSADYAADQLDRQQSLADSLSSIQEQLNENLADLAESHQDRLTSINDQLDELNQDFADSQADRQEALQDSIVDVQERAQEKRESLTEQLAQATTDTEREAINKKLAALDEEEKKSIEKLEAKAAKAEERAQRDHDKQVAMLQKRIAKEEEEYAKQQAKLELRAAEQEEKVQKQYDKQNEIARKAYDREVADAKESLAEIEKDRQQALADAQKDYEEMQASLKDKFTPIDLGLAVQTPLIQASRQTILDLADAISKIAPVEDDAVLAGETMLLSFTNIGADVFPRTTQALVDMATFMNNGLPPSAEKISSTAIQLGKALNDPIGGIDALTRVGVKFTDEQKNTIKSLVGMGDIAGAQGVILSELETEFGGAAAAAGDTFAGKLVIAKNTLGNMSETIGTSALPMLTEFATRFITWLSDPAVQTGITNIATKVGELCTTISTNLPIAITYFQQGFDWIQSHQELIIAALAMLGVAIGVFIYTTVIPAIIATISAIGPVLLVLAAVGAAAYVLALAWKNNWGDIQGKTQAVITFVKNLIQSGMQFIHDLTNGKLGALSALWSNNWNLIKTTVANFITIIKTLVEAFQAAFHGDWYTFGEKLRTVWDTVWNQFTTIVKTVWSNIKIVVSELVTNIIDFFKETDWGEVGSNIVQGIANGITNAVDWIVRAAQDVGNAALEAIKGFLGIQSPSTVMEKQVGWQMGMGVQSGWVKSMESMRMSAASEIKPITSSLSTAGVNSQASSMSGTQKTEAGPTIVVPYQPMFADADEREIARRLAPSIKLVLREMGIG